MKKIFAMSAIAAAASLAIIGAAQAQGAVPAGQDFYATPMQKGVMMTMPQAKIAQPAPAKKPMMKMHRKMTKKMMMTKKMSKKM